VKSKESKAMSRRLLGALGVATLLLAVNAPVASAQSDNIHVRNAKSKALAERIDKIIYKRLEEAKIKPGPKADLAAFGRRLHIDLGGKIPTLLEIRDFVDPTNDSPTKLEDTVDRLLAQESYARNFSHYWRTVMLQGTNNQQQFNFEVFFEGWLRQQLADNKVGYDKIARAVFTAPPFQQQGFTPSVFYFLNENKAENLAGATARVFLGVKIECAQCHKHPFAKWTRQQFWEYAAFFSGVQPRQGPKGQQFNMNSKEIRIPETDTIAKAKFITGEEPQWRDNVAVRETLADWATSGNNPYFAKAAVDHVWQYFFGVGLMEPIMEPTDDSPPAHPELLDTLAQAFVDSGFDLKFLIRAIVLTEAYARSSVSLSEESKLDIQMFARMPVRGMMPEQLFDSLCEATNFEDNTYKENPFQQQQFGPQFNTPRAQFLAKFTTQDKRIETQTSILQALFLMNGKFINERCQLENNKSLQTIATANTTTQRRVETLYMLVLSRLPRPDESAKLVRYIESGAGGTSDPRQAVADVCWSLLNSSEFMLNH
jgi:Protein of unknown function (DUF1553)/Protein of unknown function (DUF1549)